MSEVIHFIRAGGFVMYPLLLLSLIAVGVIAERFLAFRQMGHLSPGLLSEVERRSIDGDYDAAMLACQASRGPVAACLGTVIRHRHQPVSEVERLVEETGQEYFIALECFLPILDTATTISPLMGLLGTIVGMIGAFNAIALQQAHGNNDAVLHGVGEALYATATGITIAVLCFIAYNYFSARLRNVVSETERSATRLINVLTEQRRQKRDSADALASSEGKEPAYHGVQAGS
jgi:biopolymer transport protein ExbB